MSAWLASLLGAGVLGGIIVFVEAWIRRREAEAVDAERLRQDAAKSKLATEIRTRDAEIGTRAALEHAAIDDARDRERAGRPTSTERLDRIRERNRS
jgi:hypothetical protein